MRFINADLLKMHIRWDCELKGGYDDVQKIDKVIDDAREIKILERDNGAEPKLEEINSIHHESYADGTGAMISRTTLDWKCPNCGWFVGELYCGHGRWHIQGETSYCASCGQKIDWTKPKDDEKTRYEDRMKKEREEWERKNGIRLDNMGESKRKKYGIQKEGELI